MATIFCMFIALALAAIAAVNWVITGNEGKREHTDIRSDMAPIRWVLSAGAAFFMVIGLIVLAFS